VNHSDAGFHPILVVVVVVVVVVVTRLVTPLTSKETCWLA
jgi:hypothetical protein